MMALQSWTRDSKSKIRILPSIRSSKTGKRPDRRHSTLSGIFIASVFFRRFWRASNVPIAKGRETIVKRAEAWGWVADPALREMSRE